MDKLNKKILLTNAGTTVAQNFIEYNKDFLDNIYAVDISFLNYAAQAVKKGHFFIVPPIKKWRAYKKALLDICRTNKIDIIIPCSNDFEAKKLARDRQDFLVVKTDILLPSYQTMEICDDKYLANLAAKKIKIKTPSFYLPTELPDKIQFPLIMKNRFGCGSEDKEIIKDRAGLEYFLSKNKKQLMIFQRFISGPEYSVDLVLDNNSNIIVASCRERLTVKSGLCTKTTIIDNKKLIKEAQRLAKHLRLIGGVNIQFIRDYFIEVNPRLPGGLGLVSAAGFNMGFLAVKSFYGLPITEKEKEFKKVKVFRVWKEIVYG